MKKKLLILIAAVLVLGGLGAGYLFYKNHQDTNATASDTNSFNKDSEGGSVTGAGTIKKDITYCTTDGQDLKLDIYYPKTGKGPFPMVVYVHGGGWTKGSKEKSAGLDYVQGLLDAGIAVSSINYRLAPKYPFPAQIEDTKCAMRFLQASASKYNLNGSKFGAMGVSAGGHLVNLLGVTDKSAGFDKGTNLDQSGRVLAVVAISGPTDITAADFQKLHADLMKSVFSNSQSIAKNASPVTYISSDDPAFLLIHGTADKVVPYNQAVTFNDKLKAAGVTTTLITVEGAGHAGGVFRRAPATIDPAQKLIDFFKQYLL